MEHEELCRAIYKLKNTTQDSYRDIQRLLTRVSDLEVEVAQLRYKAERRESPTGYRREAP
jgi:hypothetical protein